MGKAEIVGLVLITLGVLDPLLAILVIGPRVPDPERRKWLTVVLSLSGVVLMALGVLILAGVIKLA